MRQRLGIAHALLGDPEVLILDEPANGLDPAGIRWMRDLLRVYADRGSTVLLSSHLLHEIQVVTDDLVVIGNGRIVAQGTKADHLSATGTQVRTRHPDQLKGALAAAGPTCTDSIGIGLTHARTRVLILVEDLDIRVIDAATGELLRELTLDPTKRYQSTGLPPGPTPK